MKFQTTHKEKEKINKEFDEKLNMQR
jgi:hypothetical protein